MNRMKRIDIISDTHGLLSPELRQELVGADYIIHAGDIISYSDYKSLMSIAEVKAVLGNNDYEGEFGPAVKRHARFQIDDLTFDVSHYEQRINLDGADVCIFGHTHRPVIKELLCPSDDAEKEEPLQAQSSSQDECTQEAKSPSQERIFLINPGSPTFPRTSVGPTMARLWIRERRIEKPEIIELDTTKRTKSSWGAEG